MPWAMGLDWTLLCSLQPATVCYSTLMSCWAGEGLGVLWTDIERPIWDKQADEDCNEGTHHSHPSHHTTPAPVPCLTWSEGQRCRWTRSPSLCSRWGAVPGARPSCGPVCSAGEMYRAGGKHRTIKTTTPQNFHVKDLVQLFTKKLIFKCSVKLKSNDVPKQDPSGQGKEL